MVRNSKLANPNTLHVHRIMHRTVYCSSCCHSNRGGSRFCNRCGRVLSERSGEGGAVTFSLSDGPHRGMELVTVRFSEPLHDDDEGGQQYWITLIERDRPDDEWGRWQYVDDGAWEVQLRCPRQGGIFEIRLHGRYEGPSVLHRETIRVQKAREPTATASFTLTADHFAPEADVVILFDAPVPSPREQRYWVTIVDGWEPDTHYGYWKFVPNGATQVCLVAPQIPGSYEVRLHSHHPIFEARLVQRTRIYVGRTRARGKGAKKVVHALPKIEK